MVSGLDEVIVCKCGNQAWILGTSGARCSECGIWLTNGDCTDTINYDVRASNEYMKNLKNK